MIGRRSMRTPDFGPPDDGPDGPLPSRLSLRVIVIGLVVMFIVGAVILALLMAYWPNIVR